MILKLFICSFSIYFLLYNKSVKINFFFHIFDTGSLFMTLYRFQFCLLLAIFFFLVLLESKIEVNIKRYNKYLKTIINLNTQ